MAPTLVALRTALPPEGALRLQPGEAGSAAPAGIGGDGGELAGGANSAAFPSNAIVADSKVAGLVFYTTGRLTSEMVIKSAQMGVPIVVSRSGITQMGHQVAESVGLCAIGRATNKRFLCYSGAHRLKIEPGLVVKPDVRPENEALMKPGVANVQEA